jgi:hypothetical protein
VRLTRYNHFNYEIWHRWYAWRPVYVPKYGLVWLEYVERKGWHNDMDNGWDYRLEGK